MDGRPSPPQAQRSAPTSAPWFFFLRCCQAASRNAEKKPSRWYVLIAGSRASAKAVQISDLSRSTLIFTCEVR